MSSISALHAALSSALSQLTDLSALLLSPAAPPDSNARVHALLIAAFSALRGVKEAGALARGDVGADFLEHISRHRSDPDGNSPFLFVQQQVTAVLAAAAAARARSAALDVLSAAIRGVDGGGAVAPDSGEARGSFDVTAELARIGLLETWRELFDAHTGNPVAIALSDDSVQSAILPPQALELMRSVPAAAHAKLSDVLHRAPLDVPWKPLSTSDLEMFYSPFAIPAAGGSKLRFVRPS